MHIDALPSTVTDNIARTDTIIDAYDRVGVVIPIARGTSFVMKEEASLILLAVGSGRIPCTISVRPTRDLFPARRNAPGINKSNGRGPIKPCCASIVFYFFKA
jgi:hypothetical protein